jgi:NADPH-dependent glutamate synthase beta subunit-like oxidoreductase
MLKIAKRMFHAAVVGSGPAGFYSAQELLAVGATRVDLIERLPQPFGLVRTGIAPGPRQRQARRGRFAALLRDEPRLRFFGNVNVASDNNSNNVQFSSAARVSFDQLRRDYPVVVLALGSQRDRMLGVDGERTLRGVYSARTFAAWYNSSPLAQQLPFADELRRAKSVAIVGNGNVALDVARLLCKDRDELSDTDISPTALEALRQSSVRDVHIIGRRGLIHASFTNRELREILSLPGCNINVKLDEPLSDADVAFMNSTRQGKRQLPLVARRHRYATAQRDESVQYHISFLALRGALACRRERCEPRRRRVGTQSTR